MKVKTNLGRILDGVEADKLNENELVLDEGESYFDIRFYAYTPDGELNKLIINVEAQNDYYVEYDVVTRAIFYCARMLSSQYGKEFTNSQYQNIRKVYSIWICPDVPQKVEYTITSYKMSKSDIYGKVPDNEYYDLLEAVIICLGKEENKSKGTKLHRLISTLLFTSIKVKDKKQVLKQEYDIDTSVELEERMRNMCNLADGIEARAMEKGMAKGLAEGRISLIRSCRKLGISDDMILENLISEFGMNKEQAENLLVETV